MPPTADELKRALPILFRVAVYCAAYHRTFVYFYPDAVASGTRINHRSELVPTFDAVIEGTLMNIRKSAEFFKPATAGDRDDSLYSYRYPGFTGQDWIVHRDDYLQFHKRVGHLTVEEVREGVVTWDAMTLSLVAMRKWAEFYGALTTTYADDAETAAYCRDASRVLTNEADRMERLGQQSRAAEQARR